MKKLIVAGILGVSLLGGTAVFAEQSSNYGMGGMTHMFGNRNNMSSRGHMRNSERRMSDDQNNKGNGHCGYQNERYDENDSSNMMDR